MAKEDIQTVSVKMPSDLLDFVEQEARAKLMSRGAVVRGALLEARRKAAWDQDYANRKV